jgi:hypothetical protein
MHVLADPLPASLYLELFGIFRMAAAASQVRFAKIETLLIEGGAPVNHVGDALIWLCETGKV